MFIKLNKSIILTIVLFSVVYPALSQNTLETFGKNRIQYKQFDWKFLTTTNFEIYYYQEGTELANFAARYAESDFDRIADLLGYTPYSKTKIFIYNSITDLQQSNVGLGDENFVSGGQTNFLKSRVEIPYTGNRAAFKKELSLGIANMFITEMMFGGSLRDMVQSSYLLSLPEWFMSGAAAYVAEGWSVEMDDYIRDAVVNKNLKRPSVLSGEKAVIVGQSIWNFIAERYGKSNISNILNLTRIIRNEESSIASTLGLPYNRFIGEWKNYYASMANTVTGTYVLPERDFIIRKNRRNKYQYNEVAISPDNSQLAFSENFKGKYNVYVRKTDKKRQITLMSGGSKVINQRIDPNIPLLAWRNNKELVVIHVRNGKNFLSIYEVDRRIRRRARKPLNNFSQVEDFGVSDDGSTLVMSASRNGKNDIFIYDLSRNSIKQVTNDIYDDLNPQFLANSNSSIVFSSNRLRDSLNANVSNNYQIVENSFDLFIYNPDKSTAVLERIASSQGDELQAIVADENTIFYLNNENGIRHLYKYNVGTRGFSQVSNFQQNIQKYDVNAGNNSLAYLMTEDGNTYLGFKRNFDFNAAAPFVRTRRNETLDERAGTTPGRNIFNPPPVGAVDPARTDTTDAAVVPPPPAQDRMVLSEGEVDTDNYQFDIDVKKQREENDNRNRRTLLNPPTAVTAAKKQNVTVRGPFPYQSRFSADNVISSVLIDPLRGLGVLFTISMNDILENHKVYGGVLGFTDLRSSNFFGEYQYLKSRIDYGARFDKKTIFVNREGIYQRYNLNKFQLTASYPFSVSSRVTLAPFYAHTRFTNINFLAFPDANTSFGGVRAEYVFDNTQVNGLNMIEGTRMKVRFENYMGINQPEQSFNNLSIDLRNYQRIHRDIIFATRLAYGQFGGRAKKNYLLGGMDNWIFNQREDQGEGDPLNNYSQEIDNRDQLFLEFVTNLRGFNYNKLYGNNFLLFNAEFRFPVIKYFYRGPITSNFFKNFQLVAFTDVGAAWTGRGPFSRQNSLNTTIVGGRGNPFKASVTNFKNPFLSGHGVGARTLLLGYYVKFDVAWGVEDFVIAKKPKYYLTFGYDF